MTNEGQFEGRIVKVADAVVCPSMVHGIHHPSAHGGFLQQASAILHRRASLVYSSCASRADRKFWVEKIPVSSH